MGKTFYLLGAVGGVGAVYTSQWAFTVVKLNFRNF